MDKEKIKRKSITLYFTESNTNEMNLYNALQNFESPLSTINANVKSILYELLVIRKLSYMEIFNSNPFSSNSFYKDDYFKESYDESNTNIIASEIKEEKNIDYDFFDELEDKLK